MTELLRLPYTPDLTQAGVAWVKTNLTRLNIASGAPSVLQLRQQVASKAALLAFQRYLGGSGIPYQQIQSPLTVPDDHTGMLLGGRSLQLFTCLVDRRSAIQGLRHNPDDFERAKALAPAARVEANAGSGAIYMFAFVLGLVTNRCSELRRAMQRNLPSCCMWLPPLRWRQNTGVHSLGQLVLKSNSEEMLNIAIDGSNLQGEPMSENLELHSRQRTSAASKLHTLNCLSSDRPPSARVAVRSVILGETLTIEPLDWRNIWVYGMEIIFAGYLAESAFRKEAQPLPAGSDVYPQHTTLQPSLSLPVTSLHPARELLASTQLWYTKKIGS